MWRSVAIGVVLAGVLPGCSWTDSGTGNWVIVPDVVGLNVYYATVAIKKAGLCTAKIADKATNSTRWTYPILRQSPKAGARVAEGTGVSLVEGVPGSAAPIGMGVPREVGACRG